MKGETSNIRFSEAEKLLDYGFNNYEYVEFAKKDDTIKTINVDKGIYKSVDAILESDNGLVIKKGMSSSITTNIALNETISAPVLKGQKLGEITYLLDGKEISKVNILAKQDVKKISTVNMSSRIIKNWFNLLR